MPWWAAAYMALYATLSVAVAIVDVRGRREGRWRIALDVLTAAILLAFAASWWHTQLVSPLGRWAGVLLVLVVGWDVYSISRDIAAVEPDPGATPRENARAEWAGIVVTACLMAPVYALAVGSVVKAWRAA